MPSINLYYDKQGNLRSNRSGKIINQRKVIVPPPPQPKKK